MKMNKLRNWWISALLVVVSFVSQAQSNGFEVLKSMELMDMIFQHLDMYYVDETKPGNMTKTAIDAMLKELDPYTVYYHESNMEDYRLMTTGQYGGIGALVRKIGDFTYISEPYANSPASKAGAKAGDIILEIDGKDMVKKDSEEVSNALKGPKGSVISVLVERNGKKEKLAITREEIKLPDVPYSGLIRPTVGYIKLNSFTQTAYADIKTAYDGLKLKGMQSLILDLRGNPGGLLIEAIKIVNMFVKKGQTVVTTKGRIKDENKTYKTTDVPVDLAIPVVVLIDGGSASASEIVSGSLQDLDRAVIIGETSYGKGLVQRTFDLKYGSKMKLTISKYYTPSGRCVQRLEYYDKESGEKPKEVADSLLKTFTTLNGRKVIDGRGIEPDVKIELEDLSRLAITLLNENVIFNYATYFANRHPNIAEASVFKLTNEEYEDFKNFALKQNIKYTTASEEQMKKLKEIADKEGFYGDVSKEYDALMSKVIPSTERDLEKFKDEIKDILENEIVSRYYFQDGRAEQSFQKDAVILKSIEILGDSKKYNTILGR